MAFSADGKRIVSGSQDNTVKVWDADKGTELLTLKGHTNWVNSVAFSADGKRIVSGSWDNTVKVWDADKGTEMLTLKGHTGWVTSVAFSPDGKRIVSGSGGWMPGKPVPTRSRCGTPTRAPQRSPSRGTQAGSTAWLQPRWQTHRQRQRGQHGEGVGCRQGTETLTLKGHTGPVTSVAFSPDGKRIVSGSQDTTMKVWDADTGTEIAHPQGAHRLVTSVAFSPDGKRIVSGSQDNTVKVWDADKGPELLTLKGHTSWSPAWRSAPMANASSAAARTGR